MSRTRVAVGLAAFSLLFGAASRSAAQSAPAMCTAVEAFTEPPAWTQPLAATEAHALYAHARNELAHGRVERANAELLQLASAFPEVADHLALLRGDAALADADPEGACRAFATATASADAAIAARGRVGAVRCLIAARDRRAEAAFEALLRRYTNLPERTSLELELALARVRWGDVARGIETLSRIDFELPGHYAGIRARRELDQLRARGVAVPERSLAEQVDRLERLGRSGPPERTHEALDALPALPELPSSLRARVADVAARLAREEGRFDDARAFDATAHPRGTVQESATARPAPADQVTASAPRDDADARARARVLAIARARGARRPNANTLLEALVDAGRLGEREAAGTLLDLVRATNAIPITDRFDAVMAVAGVVDDEIFLRALAAFATDPAVAVRAQYHHARTLERMGRLEEARRELESIAENDRSEGRYYALWAQSRIASLASAAQAIPAGTEPAATFTRSGLPLYATAPQPRPTTADDAVRGVSAEATRASEAEIADDADDRARAIALLTPIAAAHRTAFPWFARAVALATLGESEAAGDELFQAANAWRVARRKPAIRAGLEAVYRGPASTRPAPLTATLRRARSELTTRELSDIARAASLLGDEGTAVMLVGRIQVAGRPRPYRAAVLKAAAEYGVDPNLLWAVMRVESVYNRRIVSYAGAIGLMQIMPRTGTLIADRVGRPQFLVSDLLHPTTNVEFAAWYLRSLIDRFDGRLPLAIAAYNGGPHNVRKWMDANAPRLPLDAFLERIPFGQTWRYVRRVLGHYRAYREQAGLAMVPLDTALPSPRPDPIAF